MEHSKFFRGVSLSALSDIICHRRQYSGSRAVLFDMLAVAIGVSFTTDSDNTISAGTGTSVAGVGTGSLLMASALVFCAHCLYRR